MQLITQAMIVQARALAALVRKSNDLYPDLELPPLYKPAFQPLYC
jgi:hypothetical protein